MRVASATSSSVSPRSRRSWRRRSPTGCCFSGMGDVGLFTVMYLTLATKGAGWVILVRGRGGDAGITGGNGAILENFDVGLFPDGAQPFLESLLHFLLEELFSDLLLDRVVGRLGYFGSLGG